jgi:DNA-binding response OmpR family regulator
MNSCAKTILVVDDEPKIVEVVKSYLEHSGCRVVTALSGKEAAARLESDFPDLVILDWMLPDISGEEICRSVRERSRVPVIMLTARADEEAILRGFDFGADDYVTKPFSPRQLVARVQAILRRAPGNDDAVLHFDGGELTVNFESLEVTKRGVPVCLTPNEFKIVGALAQRPKKVFTREELIDIISGQDFDGFDRVIDTHIKNIRQKIETDSKNPRYILTVRGAGYRFGGELK